MHKEVIHSKLFSALGVGKLHTKGLCFKWEVFLPCSKLISEQETQTRDMCARFPVKLRLFMHNLLLPARMPEPKAEP